VNAIYTAACNMRRPSPVIINTGVPDVARTTLISAGCVRRSTNVSFQRWSSRTVERNHSEKNRRKSGGERRKTGMAQLRVTAGGESAPKYCAHTGGRIAVLKCHVVDRSAIETPACRHLSGRQILRRSIAGRSTTIGDVPKASRHHRGRYNPESAIQNQMGLSGSRSLA
jgi:hypothetical protein